MKFKYTAKTLTGQTVKGRVEAVNIKAAAELIREQKMMPMGISQAGGGLGLGQITKSFGGVSGSEVANFTRQLSTMMTAGLPLTDALNLLKIQSPPAFSTIIAAILTDVQSGISLSAAMSKHPKAFSAVYVALVKAGESAGIMDKILSRLADTSEKSGEFRAQVIGAMIYPVIILLGMVGVMVIMMVAVVPKLTALYSDFGADLPIATKMIIWLSNAMTHYGIIMAIVVAVGVFLLRRYLATDKGKSQYGAILYKAPVIGALAEKVMLTELTRTLALLMSAGISIVEALNIVSDAIDNVNVKKEVKQIAKRVEKGYPVSISFTESGMFPPLLGQMMAVGEETGKMDDVLTRLSVFYESESGEKIKGLTTAIEPIILIVLAVGVGFLMYAIIMPIYGITNKI